MIFKRKPTFPTVLVASQNLDLLNAIPAEAFQVREAFSTRGVIQALDDRPALLIIDLEDLLESGDFPRLALAASLERGSEHPLASAIIIAAHERGVEISSEVADGPNSVILDQVTNGIAARMAVLFLVAQARDKNKKE